MLRSELERTLPDGSLPKPTFVIDTQEANTRVNVRNDQRQHRLVLIDESPLRRESTVGLLRMHLRVITQGFACTKDALGFTQAAKNRILCVLWSVGSRSLKEPSWAREWQALVAEMSPVPVILLADREEPSEVLLAFSHGLRGWIPTSHSPEMCIRALRIVASGGMYAPCDLLMRVGRDCAPAKDGGELSAELVGLRDEHWPPRQLAVLQGLVSGRANKDIARRLRMQESTVKVHVHQILRKLGAQNRTQAAIFARRLGILAGPLGELTQPGGESRTVN